MAVRLALAGLGDIGTRAHLPALVRAGAAGRVDLVGVVEPDPGRWDPSVTMYDSVEALLKVDRPDGFVLATPPWVTTGLAARLLDEGFAVLAEKPLATSIPAAEPLASLGPEALSRLQTGLTYRHDPALDRLRRWRAEGPLDGPLLIRAHVYDERRDPADPEHEARIRRTLEHGNPAVHEGAHIFDWLAYVMGERPEVVDRWAITTGPDLPAPNLVGGRLALSESSSVALCEFGWLTDALPRCEVSFLGRHGFARLDGFTFDLELETATSCMSYRAKEDRMTRCFDRQLAAFTDVVEGREPAAVPGFADAMAALEIAEAMGAMEAMA